MKRFFSVLIICLCLTLSSFAFVACDKDKDDEKQVPVYQGMVVSSMVQPVTTFSFGFNGGHDNDDHKYNDRYHDGRDHYDDKNHHGDTEDRNEHIDQDKPFEDSVPDIEDVADSLIVVGGGESLYYASANESVYITIKLSNPDSFEIMSFTLNGKKYSSYMFEDGSDMENLILKVDVGTAVGIHDYTIDAIKYVDGTQIKDVIMDGDKTVKIGVGSEGSTTANISSREIGLSSISLTVGLVDVYNLIATSNGESKIFLYNENGVIDQKSLTVGSNNIEFNNLTPNTLYQFAVIASYDDLTGTGKVVHTLYKQAFNTHSIVLFDSEVTVSEESVSYSYVWDNEMQNKTIVSQELYLDGEKVKNIDVNATTIDNLYSNRNYTLVTTYKNLKNENEEISLFFTTLEKTTPTMQITQKADSLTQTGVEFDINVVDIDNVGSLTKLELLHGEDDPIELDLASRSVNGLLSNNDYKVKATYTFDLNDGTGSKTIVKELEFKTIAKTMPNLLVNSLRVTKTSFDFEITKTDPDNIGELSRIILWLNETEFEDIDLNVRHIGNLYSDRYYKLEVVGVCDLNDGTGIHTVTKTIHVKTLIMETPSMEILQKANSLTQTGVEFDINIIDNDNIGEITKLELLHGEDEPVQLQSTDRSISGLLSNNDYIVKATYTYNMNIGEEDKTIIKTLSFKTLVKQAPSLTITQIDDSLTQTGVEFDINISDVDSVGSLTKLELLHGEDDPVNLGVSVRRVNDLYSNNEYTIRATYTYDLNDGTGSKTLVKELEFKTIAKATPNVYLEINEDTLTQTSVEFDFIVEDEDNVVLTPSIYLTIKEGENVNNPDSYSKAIDLFTTKITDLLSGVGYTLTISYACDLNDGTGIKFPSSEVNFTTLSKEVPTVTICDVSSTQNSISFDYSVVDNDSICELSYIEIWKGEELVKKNDVDNKNFSDLDGNTKYQIRVYYSYNLNNGLESVSTYAEYDYYTLAEEVTVTDITVLNQTNPKVGEEVHVRVSFDNPSNVVLNSIFINGQKISVVGGDVTSAAIIKFIPETDGGDYEVKINKITYNKEDAILTQNVTSEYTDSVLVLGDIIVKRVYNDHEDGIFVGDNIFYVELDNPTGYDISSIKGSLGNSSYYHATDFKIIAISEDKQVLTILNDSFSYGFNGVIIDEVTYGIEGGEFIPKTISNIISRFYKLKDDKVIEISTAEELANMQDYYIYSLTADIDMKNIDWTPKSFNGVFYGNNKKIKNLSIVHEDASVVSYDRFGLFSTLNGFCDGLNIENIYMSVKNIGGSAYFGALAGNAYGKFSNIITSGIIFIAESEEVDSLIYIGGLFGSSNLNITNTIIINSSSSVSIECIKNYNKKSALGGLIGSSSNSTIENCFATGDVVFINNNDNKMYSDAKNGGFIGMSRYSTITNCYATGDVAGENSVGGFIGYDEYSTISNCYAIGDVTGSDDVGGFIGYDDYSTISNCYATGNVTGEKSVGGFLGDGYDIDLIISNCYATGDVSGERYVGGFIGYGYSIITNCYAIGDVTGSDDVGGFIGYGYCLTISNCYAIGDVIGTDYYVGGFIGEVSSSTITNSYATGDVTGTDNVGGFIGYGANVPITNSYATGNVSGERCVGGFIGYMNSSTSIISNCYATGDVAGENSVGGFIGKGDYLIITKCYATGDVTGIYQSVGGFIGESGFSEINECYKFNGQLLISAGINTYGTAASMEEIWAFVKENWDNDVWNLYDDKNPTLKEVSNS